MPLIYSFVARTGSGEPVVLADYTSFTGNFGVVAIQVRVPPLTALIMLATAPSSPLLPHPLLQALQKGGQGGTAKFTYSCDGHSECLGALHSSYSSTHATACTASLFHWPCLTWCALCLHCSLQLLLLQRLQ